MKALIVDDDASTRMLLERTLRSRLHRVRHATDAGSALAACRSERFSLVVLSWRLATAESPPLLQRMRELPNGDQVLVFALVDGDDPREPGKALAAGANDYLPRPVDPRLFEWRLTLAERQSGELSRRRNVEDSLRQLEKAISTMQLGVTISDLNGTILFANPAEAEMHGYTVQELIGRNASDFSSDPRGARRLESLGSVRRWSRERMSRRKDGSEFPVRLMSDLVADTTGAPIGIVTSCEDISERRQAEEARRESEERYSLAVRGANDGVWDWDLRTDQIYLSPRWKRILGHDESELGAAPGDWFSRVHPEDLPRLQTRMTAHLDGKIPQLEHEYRMRHRDGTYRWVLTRGVAVRSADGKAYRIAGSQTDVTDRRGYDSLTLLPNRALFLDRLELAISRARRVPDSRFAVLFVDLDHFKNVNDGLGHLAGDQLLVGIARRLEDCVRPGDTVARFGGDEFAILLDRIADTGDAVAIADRIRDALRRPFTLSERELVTSASIGIAVGEGQAAATGILREADTALYHAKDAGRARSAVFDAAMLAESEGRARFESELSEALTGGELFLEYEPLVSVVDGRVLAVEALLRWRHPSRGVLMPADFFAAAEESGAIVAFDRWALSEACRQAAAWRAGRAGASELAVRVNMSTRGLARADLPPRLDRILHETGLPARSLFLEIGESALLEASEAVLATLAALRSRGIRLALDHFGTGLSGLSALSRGAVDSLKLDRSVVAGLPHDRVSVAFTRAASALASEIGIELVACGVETEAQRAALAAIGCASAQGRLFSRALPAAEAGGSLDAPGA